MRIGSGSIAISFWLANRSRFVDLLSTKCTIMPPPQRSTLIFSLFFLNNLLISGADSARNFPEKNRTPCRGAQDFFPGNSVAFLDVSAADIFLREEKEEK